MKLTASLFGVLFVVFFALYHARLNNVFEPSVAVYADTSRTFTVAPGDTVVAVVPVANNSYQRVLIKDISRSCRVLDATLPDTMNRKGGYYLVAHIVTPDEPGSYVDGVVFRANTRSVFHGIDIPYDVELDAPRKDTLWLGHGRMWFRNN